MHVIAVSLNHNIAPVEIREKMTFDDENLPQALKTLRHSKSILENVILSTCNRTEIYVVCDQLHTGRYYTKAFLSEWFSIKQEKFASFLTIYENEAAINHLFNVACGLDSMILGETQILGQVRDAFILAQEEGTTGTIFNELFKQVVTLAKRAHYETGIDESPVSVSYAAVQLAKSIFGSLKNKRVVILGAGETSQLTAKHLQSNGVKAITVINRTYENAVQLASSLKAKALPLTHLQEAMTECDILISSTGSKQYIVTLDIVQPLIKKRKGRHLFMIDIAVPRDIDPALDELENVFLYNIDDLQKIVDDNLTERKKIAKTIEGMIVDAIAEFDTWLTTLGVVPLISALRTKALSIQAQTMSSIERKLPDLTERELKVIRKHTKSIINQMLRDPILGLKESATEPEAKQVMETFIKIFAIEEEVAREKDKQIVSKTSTESKEVKGSRSTNKQFAEIPLRP
ncbi:glutamyl-tRNA reductase [Pueribacillus sp. YX66]|uniref:glutamyl-tRNA reductase n=1 Tax=Pueribacillus sp. YX66 TaxID=3229242 RepID=UPI00358D9C5F